MYMYEWLASAVIGTPLQRPAPEGLRWVKGLPSRLRHPECDEIYREGAGRTERLFKTAITDGMNCIDVGCHLGSVTQKFIQLSPHGRHIAVEPAPLQSRLVATEVPDGRNPTGRVGGRGRPARFFFNPDQSGFSGLTAHHLSNGSNQITVECKRLDDLVPAVGRWVRRIRR